MDNYCKVLIADDEMLVRQGIKHLFHWEQEGFTIAGEASNGKEALELIGRLSPHIVLMDIVMPVMDGEELARQIKEHYPDVKIIVLSSFSEFEYVRSTFQSGASDYILKPKLDADELLAILKKTAAAIPALREGLTTGGKERSLNAVLDKLLAGYEVEDMNADGLLASVFLYPSFYLLTAELMAGDKTYQAAELSERAAWMICRLPAWAAEVGVSLVCHELEAGGEHALILLNIGMNDAGPGSIDRLFRKTADEIGRGEVPLCLAVSGIFTEIYGLHQVSTEMPALLEKRFFMPEQMMFIADELKSAAAGKPFDAAAFAEELNKQQFLAAFERLRGFTASMSGRSDTGMYEFKSFLGHSLFTIILSLLRCHYEAASLDRRKYEVFRSIHATRDILETSVILDEFLSEAAEIVMGRSRSAGGKSIQNILLYIREHYAEPLTLSGVAQHFHFNPSYLSNYFATHNPEGFSEYLCRVRMEKACEYLRQDDMSIADVGSLVGYVDQSYFTKVFRKQMGVSPSQFRRRLTESRHPL